MATNEDDNNAPKKIISDAARDETVRNFERFIQKTREERQRNETDKLPEIAKPVKTTSDKLPLTAPFENYIPKQPATKNDESEIWRFLGITKEQFEELLRFKTDREKRSRIAVFMLGVLFMPITLIGALLGYVRGYNRFYRYKNYQPDFYPLYPVIRVAMIIGIVLAWLIVFIFIGLKFFTGRWSDLNYTIIFYLLVNFVVSLIAYGIFSLWRKGISEASVQSEKFGSARFASKDELFTLNNKTGFYIGNGHLFNDKGHILTVAGTRGGKGTNIIIPNLLGAGNMETSWVVIDPKCENAAITASYQRKIGQNVVLLNPWNLLSEHTGEAQSYNPLDILSDITNPNLVDDVQMIAEMIVPVDAGFKDPFWSDCARTIVSGLLLHLVTSQPKQDCTLTTLWKWVRLYGEDWDVLIQDMGTNNDPVNGIVIQNAANEILKLSAAGDETFGSIMSGVLQATDFLKSPVLQASLESGFDPKVLVDGKTTVYVVIPADKLKSHFRWLRLVVTSMMRSVIRTPKKRVTFLLDEFAALGYLPEIETALSTYAGYNVTVWPILQTLMQLRAIYHDNWQTFIANCTVRQFFSINDNESADYISAAIGMTSHTLVSKSWYGIRQAESSARLLITPDELRRESGRRIFMFIAGLPPTYVEKLPYYEVSELNSRASKNPYI